MKPNGFEHPKTLRCAKLLGVRPRELWGVLDRLHSITAQYAQNGAIGAVFTDDEIADRCDWGGPDEAPERLIAGLVDCGVGHRPGFLVRHSEHRLVVHDWHDHAPDYVKRNEKRGKFTWAELRNLEEAL